MGSDMPKYKYKYKYMRGEKNKGLQDLMQAT